MARLSATCLRWETPVVAGYGKFDVYYRRVNGTRNGKCTNKPQANVEDIVSFTQNAQCLLTNAFKWLATANASGHAVGNQRNVYSRHSDVVDILAQEY